ncbi:MAG TPA: discoidin domain-containing protein, partial [Candidatus Sulfotelmatobacter sp.]|nr:discoidin domain-containing protein [Candidatus Sulfotelmatobacter sp.]
MKAGSGIVTVCCAWFVIVGVVPLQAQPVATNFALHARATASSVLESRYSPSHAVDGLVSDDSRWVSRRETIAKWLELDLGQPRALRCAHIYSGWEDSAAIRDFVLEAWQEGQWRAIPGAKVAGNAQQSLALT